MVSLLKGSNRQKKKTTILQYEEYPKWIEGN